MKSTGQRVLRKPELMGRIGLSDVTLWRMEQEGKFPRRIRLGGNSVGWLSAEIDDWLQERMENRDNVCRRPGQAAA